MLVYFNLNFKTYFGQNLFIEFGDGKLTQMSYVKDSVWGCQLKKTGRLQYRYLVINPDGSRMYEAGGFREISLSKSCESVVFYDSFQGYDDNAPFLTATFTKIFFPHKEQVSKVGATDGEITIRATVPNVPSEKAVYFSGNDGWSDIRKMIYVGNGRWEIHLDSTMLPSLYEFKFILANDGDEPSDFQWEKGENHRLFIREGGYDGAVVFEHSRVALPCPRPRLRGTAIPVCSLRANNGCVVGEFLDIKLFADWAARTGQNIIQILPINDTTSTGTWTDSYPYSGITVMGLHMLYLNIEAVGELPASHKKRLKAAKTELNALNQVDYEKVMAIKKEFAAILFKKYSKEVFASAAYKEWLDGNSDWLLPYCAFCALRDKFGTADFSKWGESSNYDTKLPIKLFVRGTDTGEAMALSMFVQYNLHIQLKEAVEYAHSKGIALKGDIPIGITPNSVEAWTSPELFNMDSQAGAPPDAFSEDGQNWGFPTYNWDRMEQDGYAWWRGRFRKMAEYFDAYRIDHVLGFFRIWEIPAAHGISMLGHFSPALPYTEDEIRSNGIPFNGPSVAGERHGLFVDDPHHPGYFHPAIGARKSDEYNSLEQWQKSAFDNLYDDFFFRRNDSFWKSQAMHKLPVLVASTGMLTCAEDLGMIPACVPDVMESLKILTLEVQRMPKNPAEEFSLPWTYPYRCVSTTGSHDTSTLRAWWEEDGAASQRYFNEVLHQSGEAPKFCEPWVCEMIIKDHLDSAAMLTILPWQDWMSVDGDLRAENPQAERINVPANPKHYWRYRMHLTIEYLLGEDKLNNHLKELIVN